LLATTLFKPKIDKTTNTILKTRRKPVFPVDAFIALISRISNSSNPAAMIKSVKYIIELKIVPEIYIACSIAVQYPSIVPRRKKMQKTHIKTRKSPTRYYRYIPRLL